MGQYMEATEQQLISEKPNKDSQLFESGHPTEFDKSDKIESEKKVLFQDREQLSDKPKPKEEAEHTITEKAVVQETSKMGLSLSDEDIKRIAEEVIKKLSDKIIKEIAWEVIPQLAEDIVLRRIKELEKEIE